MKTLCDLLPRAIELGGEATGLIDVDSSFLPWPEVNDRVVALAQALVAAGIDPGDRVCVLHPRSTASFIAVHAILHAGAVMVPLDPLGPPQGLQHVIDAVEPTAIIGATATLTGRLGAPLSASTEVILHHGPAEPLHDLGVDAERLIDFEHATSKEAATPLPTPQPDDAAYIMFTSGSTGTPKGIVHTHASAMAYAEVASALHGMTVSDRLATMTPLHFDISTLDLYGVPSVGASAVAISEAELRFPANLSERLATDRATMIFTTPYQLVQLAHRGDVSNRDLGALRQIAFGGEAMAPGVLVELGQTFPQSAFLNSYGPAEVNGVTAHEWDREPRDLTEVSIGAPYPGVEIRLVDEADNAVPAGQSGEILVRSKSAMRGYWRRDDLNEQCFVELGGERFYRTGDFAHLDNQGLLQFEGRRDNRIKVRGVRIELEEIERVLDDAPGVAHAVAGRIDDAEGTQQIAAWIVLDDSGAHGDGDLDAAALTKWCRSQLPANAVPTSYIALDELPTTATGKIDRAKMRASAVDRDARGSAL